MVYTDLKELKQFQNQKTGSFIYLDKDDNTICYDYEENKDWKLTRIFEVKTKHSAEVEEEV